MVTANFRWRHIGTTMTECGLCVTLEARGSALGQPHSVTSWLGGSCLHLLPFSVIAQVSSAARGDEIRLAQPLHRSSALTTFVCKGLVLHDIIGVGIAWRGCFLLWVSLFFLRHAPCLCLFLRTGRRGLIISTSKQ